MVLSETRNKKILFSPLNWGMGHVSRSIGLIDQLLSQGNEVLIACDNEQREIYNQYYSEQAFIDHKGYPFEFGGKGHFAWDLLKRHNALRSRLNQEEKEVEYMVKSNSIDLVLSDHRYGFRSKQVPSVFITHQLNLPVRWYESSIQRMHNKLLKHFDAIWVMDDAKMNFAGKLSKGRGNYSNIGSFSRFRRYEPVMKDITSVLILSGPKVYAQQLLNSIVLDDVSYVIGPKELEYPSDCNKIVSGNWIEQDKIILRAKKIISRSGYSTIMDNHILQTEALYIPTKGQREQEYLASINEKVRS